MSHQRDLLVGALHELIRPDNGCCNQCGGHWLYRLNGSWKYEEGNHLETCIGVRCGLAAAERGKWEATDIGPALAMLRPSAEENR